MANPFKPSFGRLIDAELIERAAGRGRVDFALPYRREYLREHAAGEALL